MLGRIGDDGLDKLVERFYDWLDAMESGEVPDESIDEAARSVHNRVGQLLRE